MRYTFMTSLENILRHTCICAIYLWRHSKTYLDIHAYALYIYDVTRKYITSYMHMGYTFMTLRDNIVRHTCICAIHFWRHSKIYYVIQAYVIYIYDVTRKYITPYMHMGYTFMTPRDNILRHTCICAIHLWRHSKIYLDIHAYAIYIYDVTRKYITSYMHMRYTFMTPRDNIVRHTWICAIHLWRHAIIYYVIHAYALYIYYVTKIYFVIHAYVLYIYDVTRKHIWTYMHMRYTFMTSLENILGHTCIIHIMTLREIYHSIIA